MGLRQMCQNCISLQFADAEAYFAPCTTDTTVNNCLVRSLTPPLDLCI